MNDFEEQLRELVRESWPWNTPEGVIESLRKLAAEIEADPEALEEDDAA